MKTLNSHWVCTNVGMNNMWQHLVKWMLLDVDGHGDTEPFHTSAELILNWACSLIKDWLILGALQLPCIYITAPNRALALQLHHKIGWVTRRVCYHKASSKTYRTFTWPSLRHTAGTLVSLAYFLLKLCPWVCIWFDAEELRVHIRLRTDLNFSLKMAFIEFFYISLIWPFYPLPGGRKWLGVGGSLLSIWHCGRSRWAAATRAGPQCWCHLPFQICRHLFCSSP